MKKTSLILSLVLPVLGLVFITSCQGVTDSTRVESEQPATDSPDNLGLPIANYVVALFEDSKGHLWFGTMGKGVARYDGESLNYLSTQDGLIGNAVAAITEDQAGNLWFGTHSGLSKYDGKNFTNYNEGDGLVFHRVSSLLSDSAGDLWVGTWEGVSRYDGTTFFTFPLPKSKARLLWYQSTMNWVTDIMEDSKGNIWFTRDGYGATRYDGKDFIHFTKQEGLASNNVMDIQEDRQGTIWFGSRVAEKDAPITDPKKGEGGLSRYNGQEIVQFPDWEGLSKNDTYALAMDRAGNIWAGANGHGVYQYNGNSFTLYPVASPTDSTFNIGVQSILEDRQGRMWFGLSGGLFRLEGSSLIHVTQEGPWE